MKNSAVEVKDKAQKIGWIWATVLKWFDDLCDLFIHLSCIMSSYQGLGYHRISSVSNIQRFNNDGRYGGGIHMDLWYSGSEVCLFFVNSCVYPVTYGSLFWSALYTNAQLGETAATTVQELLIMLDAIRFLAAKWGCWCWCLLCRFSRFSLCIGIPVFKLSVIVSRFQVRLWTVLPQVGPDTFSPKNPFRNFSIRNLLGFHKSTNRKRWMYLELGKFYSPRRNTIQ